MTTATDDLADRMKRLDEAAVEDFSRLFAPRLWSFFRKRGLSRADAEALAVSCVTKVWMKIESFHPEGSGSFERWVFRLARNTWIDEARRAGKRPSVGIDAYDVAIDPEALESDGDEDLACQVEVEAAVAGLPDVDREIIRLRYIDSEETFAEIGRRLGIKGAAARVRHHRALRTLAGRLAPLRRRMEATSRGEGN